MTSTSACFPKKQVLVDGKLQNANQAAENLYREAKAAEKSNDLLTTKARLKQIVDQYRESPRRADALAELGALIFREHGCDAGLAYYETLVNEYAEHPHSTITKANIQQ